MIKRLCVFFILFFSINAYSEPSNLGLQKIELQRYYDSNQYNSDIAQKINEAKYYLQFRMTQNNRLASPKKLAIVLDIDETSLSNYEDLKHFQFGGTREEIIAARTAKHAPAILNTLSLFNYAIKNKVAIFFVTGRKESERKNTIENLHSAGYADWQDLLMEPNNYHKASAIPLKIASRQKITEMGYDVVLNIGDQMSDLEGGHFDMGIKLPNPFYYVP